MKHPSIDRLALYAGGELPFWTRWIMRRHMTGCAAAMLRLIHDRPRLSLNAYGKRLTRVGPP